MSYGPTPRWGPRNPCKVHWPAEHRALYEERATALGLSLNEYLIRLVAKAHGFPVPDHPEQLDLSA